VKRRRRPNSVAVNFRGIEYDLDLDLCQHALVRRQIDGEFDSLEALADAIERSRSTVSRFFSGRQTSLAVMLAILGKLKLSFDEVCTPRRPNGGSSAERSGTP
jgi:hypothetical protein